MVIKLLFSAVRPLLMRQRPRLPVKTFFPQLTSSRFAGDLLPPSQYDTPWPKKMTIRSIVWRNWELLPILAITSGAMAWMFFSIYWACLHKVDVVFSKTHNPSCNLSHTMDLLAPKSHKLFIINQKYKPYPEMYCVQAKMKQAMQAEEAMKRAHTFNPCHVGQEHQE